MLYNERKKVFNINILKRLKVSKNAFKCLLTRCQLFRLTMGGAGAGLGRCFFRGGVSGGVFSKSDQMFV